LALDHEVVIAMDDERLRGTQQPSWDDWNRWCDERIAAALAEHHRLWTDVVGAVIAHERQTHRTELGKLKAVLELRIDGLQHELAKERSFRGGEVVDLPGGLLRKRHDNAA
jgi:hypothetical protein